MVHKIPVGANLDFCLIKYQMSIFGNGFGYGTNLDAVSFCLHYYCQFKNFYQRGCARWNG